MLMSYDVWKTTPPDDDLSDPPEVDDDGCACDDGWRPSEDFGRDGEPCRPAPAEYDESEEPF